MKNKIFILILSIMSMMHYAQCVPSATNPDSDGDGIADICDLDDDNDGILDCVENGANPFTDVFILNNDAIYATPLVGGPAYQVRLVPDLQSKRGQAWSKNKVDFTKDFVIPMKIYISSGPVDADGMAIVFQNQGTNASGITGQGLGARGIPNGIALEIDIFQNTCTPDIGNGGNCDPAFDHGSIRTTSGWVDAGKLAGDTQLGNGDIADNAWHTVVVTWNATTRNLSYTFDGAPVTNYTFATSGANSIETILGGTSAYFGYTASTGLNNSEHRIGFDFPCDLPLLRDTDGDGIPDYLDLDSDNDGCPDAIEGGAAFTSANLVNSSMLGGNSGATSGSFNQPINQNLGNTVNTNSTSASYGVPTVAGSGQTIGTSQTANPVLASGTAGANQTITSGSTPIALSLIGATGNIQWQVSTDNVIFTNISGATNSTYAPGALTATRYYRAIVTSVGGCTSISNTVIINVNIPCVVSATNPDSDGDGIADDCDLDDDNDGILDCEENLLNKPVNEIFKINGNAQTVNSTEVRLTQNAQFQSGQLWSNGKTDFTKSFTISFQAYLGDNNDGADGIAIVFHNDPAGVNANGQVGSGIGARGIQNGIVLELDTFENWWEPISDIAADHGHIWQSSNQASLSTPVALSNLENGAWHTVTVTWDRSTNTLSYAVNGALAGFYTGDIINSIFAGANKVYFGFTGSTGGFTNEQKVRFSQTCSLPFELDTDGDGISNHLDLDSDNDGCSDAIEGGAAFTSANLVNSSMSGGNSGATSGAFNQPVTQNLGNTVNTTSTSTSYGVPTVAGSGQTIGTSQTTNPVLVAGTAGANQTITTGNAPTALSLTGATGSIQWQISNDNTTFTDISGATNTTFAPGTLTATRYYRAIVTSLGGCTAISNTVKITVNNPCLISAANPDSDGDGIADACDLDDDNDGILDTAECLSVFLDLRNLTLLPGSLGSSTSFVVGTKLIKSNAIVYLGNQYDAIVTVISKNTGTGEFALSNVGGDLALRNTVPNINPYGEFSIEFVPSGTVTNASTVFTPTTIPFLTIQFSDIDGNDLTIPFSEVIGYKTTSVPNNIISGSSLENQGFLSGGPSPSSGYSYFRHKNISAGISVPNDTSNSENFKLYLSFSAYTTGVFVLGGTGNTSIPQSERSAIIAQKSDYACDTDGDGIANQLDLDSDNDGCSDAIEGGATLTSGNLVNSSMSGGNSGATSGAFNQPVAQNLGNTVNTTSTSTSYGVPVVAGSGQTIGTSQTANPVLVAGTAGANQTITSGSTPTMLSLTGATGSIQWQVSTDNALFTNIPGATNSTYAPGALTATRYYQAIVTSAGGCTAISNTVTINITAPCSVSALQPTVSGTLTNTCPANFVDLNNAHTGNIAPGESLAWFTNNSHSGTALTAAQIANAGAGTYYAFYSNGSGCYSPASNAVTVTINSCVCYRDPVNNGIGSETKMGVTLLKRAGNNDPDNWPMVRKSGHIVLESNRQGFVVTRIAKSDLGNITNPQEGMMVYDTTDKCLKIYSDNAWKCFNIPTCP